jgi:hypothetical protein
MKGLIKFYYSIIRSLLLAVAHPELASGRKLDFIIIGAQKSGTSALDKYLRFHPKIGLSSNKELHHFNNERVYRLPARLRTIHYHRFFPDFKHPGKILGEATPNYMVEPVFMDRIHAYNPALKLIVILRDPVSRAYSHWNMQRDRGFEARSFDQAIEDNLKEIHAGVFTDPRFTYLKRGEYASQIKYIQTLFPQEQLLILFQQDLLKEPLDTLNQITGFLGTNPFKRVNALQVHRRDYLEPMSASVKTKLKAYFLPHIEDLERLLNKDFSHWK